MDTNYNNLYYDYPPVDQYQSYETPGWGSKFSIIIGWIIILALIIWLVFIIINSNTTPNPQTNVPQQPQAIQVDNSIIGASTNGVVSINNGLAYNSSSICNAGPTRNWGPVTTTQSGCKCVSPFYGEQCFTESYNSRYTAVGNPNMSDVTLPPTTEVIVDRLSFHWQTSQVPAPTQTTCTDMCDTDDNCSGVLWKAPAEPDMGTSTASGGCTLLHGNLVVNDNANIAYRPLDQSTLFLRQDYHRGAPWFANQVFMYSGILPLRYWLNSTYRSPNGVMIRMAESQLITLTFRPSSVINDPLLYGIFNVNTFSLSQAQGILVQYLSGQDVQPYVVLEPEATPIFPTDWNLFYGMYISN